MYILVKESVPLGLAMAGACHAAVACNNRFRDTEEVKAWLDGTFYKVVCVVNDSEFEKSKQCEDNVVLMESVIGGAEVAMAFKPREDWTKCFRFFRLYK